MLLTNALLADGSTVDVRLCLETIGEIAARIEPQAGEPVHDLGGRLLLPAFVEPHAHLDKAFLSERIDNPTGDLMGAILAMEANRHLITVADTIERAERAVRLMVSNGVTAVRTHADVTEHNGMMSVEALVAVRERVHDICDVQVVALTGWPITGAEGADNRARLADAIAAGIDGVGGCPHLDPNPAGANETFLAIAADAGLMVDLHTDETLNPEMLAVQDLAQRVIASGFTQRVAASHCVSLGVQSPSTQQQVAELIAAANISVITLPQTNLYLQGRDHAHSTPRGLTAIAALRSAGATVAGGADNLQDPFNLVGKGDPLETAALLVMAGHLLPADAVAMCSTIARRTLGLPETSIAVGSRADLVVVPAASVREAVAFQPAGRRTIFRGRWITI
jgi:cytosine/creatinine deaminase